MGISQAMNIGVSGLNASATALTVVSDNIANVNTTAFKANSVRFGDLVAGYYSTLSQDSDREGSGTAIMGIVTEFAQGPLISTTRWSDVAINGEGFFSLQVPGTTKVYYTRDGSFHMDKDGYLVNELGYRVLNRDGNAIKVDNPSDPSFSNYYVDSNGQIWGTPTDPSQVVIYAANANQSPKAYGSVYIRDPVNRDVTITLNDGTELVLTVGQDNTFHLQFNTDTDGDGEMDAFQGAINLSEFSLTDVDLDNDGIIDIFGISPNAEPGYYTIADVSATLASGNNWTKDNWMATSNDPQPVLNAQLRVSTFANNNGLIRQGNNLFTQGPESKFPIHGTANDGIRGNVFSSTIEGSNVDIAKEMVNMITYQASYNANSKTITTSAELLNTAVNMVR
ncbi:flagellar hook-basal body complex protein [Desulfosoma sp.]|uniref:flagellar hook-basal body complex protein n=1 Tax=Desulfosoma sp. TaxID=2603217 RepID=UPI00404A6D53